MFEAPDQFLSRFHVTEMGAGEVLRILQPRLLIYGQVDHDVQVGALEKEWLVASAIAVGGKVPRLVDVP